MADAADRTTAGYPGRTRMDPTPEAAQTIGLLRLPLVRTFPADLGWRRRCGVPRAAPPGHSLALDACLDAPVGKVPDLVQDHTGADPLPPNAGLATTATIATVAGRQFRVNAVDTAGGRVQVEPLCWVP
jgi:hypothetical protein